jgi:hypothetical protein
VSGVHYTVEIMTLWNSHINILPHISFFFFIYIYIWAKIPLVPSLWWGWSPILICFLFFFHLKVTISCSVFLYHFLMFSRADSTLAIRNDLRICVLFYCCPCALKLEQLILAIFLIISYFVSSALLRQQSTFHAFLFLLYIYISIVNAAKSNILKNGNF